MHFCGLEENKKSTFVLLSHPATYLEGNLRYKKNNDKMIKIQPKCRTFGERKK
jgi:hypothetical protein